MTMAAHADIATDGTLGPMVELKGPNMTIGAELGQTHGGNLFHSFEHFNIPTKQSATFTGPDNINNVIGRVTGGTQSKIDGTLRSEVGQANVYLINPAGVVMGPNATVDVPASLHVSTADELRFQDGSRFSATDPSASTLTLAAPETFGFLGQQAAANLQINGSQLEVAPGETLSLSAGDIAIQGSTEQDASLTAAGGTLRLEAVGSAEAEVSVESPTLPDLSPEQAAPHLGRLDIAQAELETSGDGGGLISLQAGEAHLNEARLIAENQGATDSKGGIRVGVGGDFEAVDSDLWADTAAAGHAGRALIRAGNISLNASRITSDSYRNEALSLDGPIGAAGGVVISSDGSLRMEEGAVIRSSTGVESDAGAVKLVVVDLLEVLNGAQISSSAFAEGNAGDLDIAAGAVRLDDGGLEGEVTGIFSQANSDFSGDAGTVKLTVTNLLEVLNGGQIGSSTFAAGNAGGLYIAAGAARLDGGGLKGEVTGLFSDASSGSSGNAGTVKLVVTDLLEVLNGAEISSSTWSQGNAGDLDISAGSAHLDGGRLEGPWTRLFSQAIAGSSGDAGTVKLKVTDLLEVLNGAYISSGTFAAGNAGDLDITAGSAHMDGGGLDGQVTGLFNNAYSGSRGDAGTVKLVVTGLLELLNGAQLSSSTLSAGNAGDLNIAAGSARLDGAGLEEQLTGLFSDASSGSSGDAGAVQLVVTDMLEVLNGAEISSSTWSQGNAGDLDIAAGAARLDGGGLEGTWTRLFSQAISGSSGDAGTVKLAVNNLLEILNGAYISSSTFARGSAGDLDISAGSALMDGGGLEGQVTGLFSNAYSGSSGDAGTVRLVVTDLLEMRNGAQLSSSTLSEGNAGDLDIAAGAARLDDVGGEQLTGILSRALAGSNGDSGSVKLVVTNLLELLNGAGISSSTWSEGDAGRLDIHAGSMLMDDGGLEGQWTGLASNAYAGSSGNAGTIKLVVTDRLEMLNGAQISSSIWSKGNAGSLDVVAGSARLDDSALEEQATGLFSRTNSGSSGNAGRVTMKVDGLLEISNGAGISTSTSAVGNAGEVVVTAESARFDGEGLTDQSTGVYSRAKSDASGAAGTVTMNITGLLEVLRGAQISTETDSTGNAGDVQVQAGNLVLQDGEIISVASAEATGRAGQISITADKIGLSQGSLISIASLNPFIPASALDSTLEPLLLSVRGGQFDLKDSSIDASSSNQIPAATINIQADEMRIANSSRVSTESQLADAGHVTITGGYLWLQDSQITTSAEGALGNGGDILLAPKQIILDGGFVQANTAAAEAKGGDISIASEALIASDDQLEIGGIERQNFTPGSGRNVIQAAAPLGIQGEIALATPDLDITASLVPLRTPFQHSDAILDDLCRVVATDNRSHLIALERGGLPLDAIAPSQPTLTSERLERLLRTPD
ncbi:hypothetical protein Thiosp_01027 [Thiorhodovibrio litoralis]|nr:hypothetical protein Thiosp_01027 [Thiorhodovibrio litoralis]